MAQPKRLYLESLRIGDELPSLMKPAIDRVQIARYAGASNDFNPMHVDEVAARAAGMPMVFAHALLPMGFMSQFLSDWMKGGRLSKLAVRFVKLVWPGDVLTCKGRVLGRRRDEQGRYYVDIDLWAENQKGELVLKGHATGQIFYNADDEARQKRGEAPLDIDVSEHTELPRNAKGKPIKPKQAAAGRSSSSEIDEDEEEVEVKPKASKPAKQKAAAEPVEDKPAVAAAAKKAKPATKAAAAPPPKSPPAAKPAKAAGGRK